MTTEVNEPKPESGIDWSDPNVPVGNAPPMPLWPALVAGLVWALGIVFLIMMTISRYANHSA